MAGSNPVIRKFGEVSRPRPSGTPTAADLQTQFDAPPYLAPRPGQPTYLTLDSVVQRVGAMLAVILLAGIVSWTVTPVHASTPLLVVSLLGSLGTGLYMSFTGRANAALCLLYAALEGVLLGAVSRLFENSYHGIVVQAVTGTVMVAFGTLAVYRSGRLRVTPKMTRIVIGATFGLVGLMLVNAIAYFFTPDGLGLRSGGPVAVIFSLVCIGIAAMNLVLDFDMIERGIRNGADEKFAWYASFALTVTLVWLYLEILRLLGYARR